MYSSGVDQNITETILTQISTEYGPTKEWVRGSNRRIHSHDVRALAIWPPHSLFPSSPKVNTGTSPLLVSGGQDMVLQITPAAPPSKKKGMFIPIASNMNEAITRPPTFGESIQQRIPYALNGVIAVAKDAKLVVARRATGVVGWKLGEGEDGYEKLLDMDLNVATHLTCVAIADNGSWLAVSDAVEVKLFKLVSGKFILNPRAFSDFEV